MPRRGSGRKPAPPPRRQSPAPSSSIRRPTPPPAAPRQAAAVSRLLSPPMGIEVQAPAAAAPAAGAQGPGLMAQMAATAGGVAIGSAAGHAIGNMMGGGGGGEQAQQQQAPVDYQQQGHSQPCEFELKQFLDCTNSSDISMCTAFNDTLKECRQRYGL